ncbi:MAG TPA: hypothetical protein VFP84_10805, partial [Kofleriaceae bacterium]|nr:hypothetical protein [Kofleriaceae bacterium]
VDAALARVKDIERKVAVLRALAFKRPVPARYQTADDFTKVVHREVVKDLPPARSKALSAALAHLGFLTQPIDLAESIEHATVTQAAAYYDPGAKAFFVVAVPENATMLDVISAHELTHALQDQHFDLEKFAGAPGQLDGDAAAARRFVPEGDATFVMMAYLLASSLGDKPWTTALPMVKAQLESMSNQDLESLKAQLKSQADLMKGLGGDIQKSLDAMDQIPPIVLVPLFESYFKGAVVAMTAYEHGGWPAVDELYKHPPESTEQVLHPDGKLFPTREHPHKVTLPEAKLPGATTDVLGELSWQTYFAQWKVANGNEAAAGWGGDRFVVTAGKEGALTGRIATVWDSEADAAQFVTAYVASLSARFPGTDSHAPEAGIARSDGGRVFVRRVGNKVFIVDGASDHRAIDALLRDAKFD